MKEIIILLLTFAILAVQYHLGLMRKPGFAQYCPPPWPPCFGCQLLGADNGVRDHRASVRAGRGCGLGSGPAEGR